MAPARARPGSRLTLRTLAVIPARGGSKGVPRKNVRPLCGKPLIVWSIEQARAAGRVERVVVSTDDAEIAAVAQAAGADIVPRPADLSGDTASSESALLHALDWLQDQQGYAPDIVAMIQCTSPLLLAADIDGVVAKVAAEGADSALTVAPHKGFLWRPAADSWAGINHDKAVRLRRQDLPPEYIETGAVYAMRTAGFRAARHRFFGRTLAHQMPADRAWEIDDPVDFDICEGLLRRRLAADAVALLPPRIGAVVFDFDGVMTDNAVYTSQTGEETVMCDRGDGHGVGELRHAGVPLLVLSREVNPVVQARCRKLKLEGFNAVMDKLPALREWAAGRGLGLEQIVYVGNDEPDVACLLAAGCGVCPADAHDSARRAANLVLTRPGGRGAVRELADLILAGLADGRLRLA